MQNHSALSLATKASGSWYFGLPALFEKIQNYSEAIDKMTRIGDVFEPDVPTTQLYDRLYKEVYKKIYKRMQPLYKSIRDITGYPKK